MEKSRNSRRNSHCMTLQRDKVRKPDSTDSDLSFWTRFSFPLSVAHSRAGFPNCRKYAYICSSDPERKVHGSYVKAHPPVGYALHRISDRMFLSFFCLVFWSFPDFAYKSYIDVQIYGISMIYQN